MTLWALKNTQLLYKETSLCFFTMTENTGFQVIFAGLRQMDSEAFISINILRFCFFLKNHSLQKKTHSNNM